MKKEAAKLMLVIVNALQPRTFNPAFHVMPLKFSNFISL